MNRLLFRLVNYFRPKSLIEVGIGNGASIGYMRAACHTMDSITLKGRDWTKTSRQLEEKLSEVHTLDCLHIGHTPFIKKFLNWYFLMPDLVVVLLSEEFMNRGKTEWWEQIVTSESTGITFDLYDIGLVFLIKQDINSIIL